MSLKRSLVKSYISFRSWKTKEKILVLESDDWGSERTRHLSMVPELCKINPRVADDAMTLADTIASADDLCHLFEVLNSVKDCTGAPAVLTANVCTANPDFEKIRDSKFTEFFYEPFYNTIQNKPDGASILQLWQKGIDSGIFFPQLHGREHVHAMAWLSELQSGNPLLRKAFDFGAWGIPYKAMGIQRRHNLQAALDVYGFEGEEEFQNKWIEDSVRIFESYFKFTPATLIPPAYTWNRRILRQLSGSGIRGVQGISIQYEPRVSGSKKYRQVLHINGTKYPGGLLRLSRNAFFEPFSAPEKDWVDSSLKAVEVAFANKQPAIVGCHRVNFVGVHDLGNRDRNLLAFGSLLNKIVQKWPEVRFLNSAQLLDRMGN